MDLICRQKQLHTCDGNILANDLVKDLADEYEIAYQIHTDLDYWYEVDYKRQTIRCWKVEGHVLTDFTEVIKGEEIALLPVVAPEKHPWQKDRSYGK